MKKYLGEFEELVLTMVCILGNDSYGNRIVEEVQKQLGRNISLSAVHITLYRLEDKGMVTSYYGGATAKRGGRRKRFFQISNAGKNVLMDIQSQRKKLWRLLPNLKFGY